MQLKRLTPQLSVTPQIAPEDLPALAAQGFTTLIGNRPDGEQPGQPDHQAMQAAAEAAGLRYAFLPVVSGQVTAEHGQAFAELLAQAGGPVVAYCRTGTRSTILWALSQAGKQPWPQIVKTAADAGYDLSQMPLPPAARG